MYGKLINGALVAAPENLVFDNVLYIPATEAVLKAAGYKPVEFVAAPDDGNIYAEGFSELKTKIKQTWTLERELTPEEKRKRAYETSRTAEYDGELYTVDELKELFYRYFVEDSHEAICEALKSAITAAKAAIRELYPDTDSEA